MPAHVTGMLSFNGKQYPFGSGGVPGHPHIPYGDYPITPNAIGEWGLEHGALGLNNDHIWDADLGRWREGIELHPGSGQLFTEGCIAFPRELWPEIRQEILKQIGEGRKLYLHAHPNGFSIDDKPTV